MTNLHNAVSCKQNFLFFFLITTVLNRTVITLTALSCLSLQGQKAIKGSHVCSRMQCQHVTNL